METISYDSDYLMKGIDFYITPNTMPLIAYIFSLNLSSMTNQVD